MNRSPLRRVESLEARLLLTTNVLISEFMASNREALIDNFDASSDWIELHNPSAAEVDLTGWSLTDDLDDLGLWPIPDGTKIGADAYLLFWASGRDLAEPTPHTNFKLKASGEFLGLVDESGNLVSSYGDPDADYPPQQTDISYGVVAASETPRYFADPTPGSANPVDSCVLGFVADTKFSADRSLVSEAFTLEIATTTPNATIVYTLDGSLPSADHGVQVKPQQGAPTASIHIDSTSTVRAMAFREGWEPTNVDTQTYLFLDQVIQQTDAGLPDTWGHAGADYEMDPAIVNHATYGDEIIDGLKSLPSLSLVTDLDNWFGRNGVGIYPQGSSVPRPVSAELIHSDGWEGFQVDASIEIQGGSSTNRWKSDKLSMQLKFKRELGDAKLEYPLFGEAAATEFDTLVLDARLNQSWHYGGGSSPVSQRTRAQFTRDQFVADLQNELGGHAAHGQWVHVYLNGIYWGMHNLHERPDEHFAAAYLGGDSDDYDVIKHNTDVVNGSLSNYRDLLDAAGMNLRSDANYQRVVNMLDMDEFVSYMLVNYYVGNTDWAHHNWYATFNKVSEDGKWRYHSWDAEHVLRDLNDDVTGRGNENGPTFVHQQLMQNEDYALRFMDAVQQTMFDDGLLTPERATEVYQRRLDHIYLATVPESARWGDNQRNRPYTRDGEWAEERDRLLEDYFPQRTDRVISHLRARGFFHAFDAPEFNVRSGQVEPGFEARLRAGSAEISFTTDGSDPRTSNTVANYDQPIVVDRPLTIKARSQVDGAWSALVEVTLQPTVRGDFSGDGVINVPDIDLLFAAIREPVANGELDLSGDQQLNQDDVTIWVVEVGETRRGDANLDGQVNFADFLSLSSNFGALNASWGEGDFSGDGRVGFEDFLLLSADFGFGSNN